MSRPAAIAIGAHPDDIEFRMAGTLLLLKEAGYAIHYFNVANGNCGSAETGRGQTARIRAGEARRAAGILGAYFHPSITNDLEIFYDLKLLKRVAAVIREVNPAIVLTHPPEDYMEDHTNTCRLAVTAAFARGMPNFGTAPARKVVGGEVTVYHSLPHGFCDPLRARLEAGLFVNTASVQETKRLALAQHKSQQAWLDSSQGFNSYIQAMEDMSLQVGRMSGKFKHAEGWRRHSHYGFSAKDIDPLAEILGGACHLNQAYERKLRKGK